MLMDVLVLLFGNVSLKDKFYSEISFSISLLHIHLSNLNGIFLMLCISVCVCVCIYLKLMASLSLWKLISSRPQFYWNNIWNRLREQLLICSCCSFGECFSIAQNIVWSLRTMHNEFRSCAVFLLGEYKLTNRERVRENLSKNM